MRDYLSLGINDCSRVEILFFYSFGLIFLLDIFFNYWRFGFWLRLGFWLWLWLGFWLWFFINRYNNLLCCVSSEEFPCSQSCKCSQ